MPNASLRIQALTEKELINLRNKVTFFIDNTPHEPPGKVKRLVYIFRILEPDLRLAAYIAAEDIDGFIERRKAEGHIIRRVN